MSTLFIKDLIFSGTHGATGRELHDTQRFGVDIEVDVDTRRAEISDALADTYDYKDAKNIIRHTIESERHTLIETIASRITERICDNPKVQEARICLTKLDASDNGSPGIILAKKRTPESRHDRLLDFDLSDIIRRLERDGGCALPILSEDYRRSLLEEAERYQYVRQPEIVGPMQVREELSSFHDFPTESLFLRLRNDFIGTLKVKEESLGRSVFSSPLVFNDMSLQLYEKGSFGISPHKDGKSCINLICLFVLKGKARLALCDNRLGENPRVLDTTPGNLILFRAPGFLHSDVQPLHLLSDITEDRIVFGLRQKTSGSM